MSNDINMRDAIRQGLESTASGIGAVFKRIGVHVCSLLAAGIIAGTETSQPLDIVAAYIGLICIFPRGNISSLGWQVPTALGIAQTLLLLLFGQPGYALFAGGLQTWTQRLVYSRGKLGWEWSVLPMLLMCCGDLFMNRGTMVMNIVLLLTFPIFLVGGWMFLRKHEQKTKRSHRSSMLEQAKQTLKNAVERHSLNDELQSQSELLLKQSGEYSRWGAGDPSDPFSLAQRILATAQTVDKLARTASLNAEAEKNSDISRWINSARRGGHKTGGSSKATTDDLILKDVKALNALLIQKNGSGMAQSSPQPDEYAEYERSARELLQKKGLLPEEPAAFVEKISFATLNIVESMRNDPADVAPGKRFLGKYLPITHRIIDEHKRLAAMNVKTDDINGSLARSHEMLERLSNAFADEYAALQQNDAINFTAELNALDAVLKMQGH